MPFPRPLEPSRDAAGAAKTASAADSSPCASYRFYTTTKTGWQRGDMTSEASMARNL
jgi:hypothetical protein